MTASEQNTYYTVMLSFVPCSLPGSGICCQELRLGTLLDKIFPPSTLGDSSAATSKDLVGGGLMQFKKYFSKALKQSPEVSLSLLMVYRKMCKLIQL